MNGRLVRDLFPGIVLLFEINLTLVDLHDLAAGALA